MGISLEDMVRSKVATAFDHTDVAHFDDIFKMVIAPAERGVITYVLDRCQGNQVKAAKCLGINRNTLRKKIRIYQLGETHGKKADPSSGVYSNCGGRASTDNGAVRASVPEPGNASGHNRQY